MLGAHTEEMEILYAVFTLDSNCAEKARQKWTLPEKRSFLNDYTHKRTRKILK
jgi:hypothetical protein